MAVYRFRKYHRLYKKSDIKNVFDNGKSCANSDVVIYSKLNDSEYSRLCVIIAKKTIKKAVIRNRCRRLIREYFRLNNHRFSKNADFIFIVRKTYKIKNYSELERSLNRLPAINRLFKKTDVSKNNY